MRALVGGVIAAVIAMTTASAQTQLVSEDIMVKSPDPGIEIFVRNKRPANMTSFRPERTVVFVHGATYPAHTAFDLKLGGLSWMEYIASHGYDVYLLDLRGYGKSTRPKEMSDDMAQTLFPLLKNAPGKRYVALAEGTHTIVMEKNRMKLFEAVQSFLDEAGGS